MNKKNITITAKAQTVDYGTAISQATSQVTVATLASGDSLTSITLTPSTTNAGTGTITPSAAVIKNGNGVDVSSSYNVTSYATGALTVNVYTCTAPAATTPSKIYNGSSQASGITCPTDNNCSTASGATSTNVGTITQTCTLTDTSNYKWDDDTTDPKSYTWYINNAKVTFSKGSGTLTCDYVGAKPTPTTTADYVKYTRKGQTKLSASIRNTTYSTDIPVARKDGYTWNGWYTAASAGSKVVDYDSGTDAYTFYSVSGVSTASAWNMTADKTLYAQCTANTYKVYYYSGTTKLGESSHTYGTAKALTTYATLDSNGTYIPTGYNIPSEWSFAGWYKKSGSTTSGTTINYTDGQFVNNLTTTANDIIYLYAVYKRTITIRTGDSTSPVTYTQYYNPNASNPTSITLPAIASKSGWTSLGYRDDNDNGDINYGYEPNATVTIPLVNKPNLYAVYYKSNSATFYSGENQEYHESISGDAFYTATNGTEPTGAYITVPNTANPISDWTFTGGWSVDGSTTVAVPGDNGIELLFGETYNYYAIYEKDYTAYFYTGISKANTATQTGTVKYNTQTESVPTTITITLNGAPSSIGYNWSASGWRQNTTAAAKSYNYSQSGVSININDSNEFYSIYTRTITLNYDGNSNSQGVVPSSQTNTQYYNSNGSVSNVVFTLPAATTPTFARYGYKFNGWYSSQHQATYQYGGNSGGYAPAVNSTTTSYTLTASWTEKKYSWTIDPNGGTFEGSTNVVTKTNMSYNDKYFGTIPSPTKTGYTLKWAYYQDAVRKPSYATYTYNPNLTSAYINVVGMIPYNNLGTNFKFYNGSTLVSTVTSWDSRPSSNYTKVTRGDLSISMASNDAYGATSTSRSPFGTYVMDVSNTSNGSGSPGTGGFQHHFNPEANGQYVHIVGALCGSGMYLHFNRNGLYTDGSSEDDYNAGSPTGWLTSNKCTGAWQIYMYRINMSSSPGGSMGYVYLSNVENNHVQTGITGHFSMKVGYSAIVKVNSQEWIIPQIDGSGSWRAGWIPKVNTITLSSSASGVTVTNAGTTTIYERFDDSYYKGYNSSSGMSGNLDPSIGNTIVKPTSSTHDFKGYYTGTNGTGIQVLGADGKMTTQAKANEFPNNGTLYAKWTKKAVTTYSCRYRNITWLGSQWSCTPNHTYNSSYPSHCASLYDAGYSYYPSSNGTSGQCICDRYYYVAWNPSYGSWSSYSNYTTYPQSTSTRQYQCQ